MNLSLTTIPENERRGIPPSKISIIYGRWLSHSATRSVSLLKSIKVRISMVYYWYSRPRQKVRRTLSKEQRYYIQFSWNLHIIIFLSSFFCFVLFCFSFNLRIIQHCAKQMNRNGPTLRSSRLKLIRSNEL